MRAAAHGTATLYKYGCRCKECKTAHANSRRANYAKHHPNCKQLGPNDLRAKEYAEKHGVTVRQVKNIGVANLNRMSEDARAVMLSTAKWNMTHSEWYKHTRSLEEIFPGSYQKCRAALRNGETFTEKPYEIDYYYWPGIKEVAQTEKRGPGRPKKQPEAIDSVDRMMQLVDSLYAKRRVA